MADSKGWAPNWQGTESSNIQSANPGEAPITNLQNPVSNAVAVLELGVLSLLRSRRKDATVSLFDPDFPLTLTLSLREREQQVVNWCLADGRWTNSGTGVIERRWTIHPLPRGEGRGGETECSPCHSPVLGI